MSSVAGLVAILLHLPPLTFAQVLNVPYRHQEQDQWCWAAVSSATLSYYGAEIDQCTIAEYTRSVATWHDFGPDDCCVNPSGGCNYWNFNWGTSGSIQDILAHWGVLSTGTVPELSLTDVRGQITTRHPFIIRWGWWSGGGHFVVGHGIIDSSLYLMDPWYGPTIANYNWVVYGGNHTWTHTNILTSDPPSAGAFALTAPSDGATDQPIDGRLEWETSANATRYDLYLGRTDPPTTKVDSNLSSTFYQYSALPYNTTFYWSVVAKIDIGGTQAMGSPWRFTTTRMRTITATAGAHGAITPTHKVLLDSGATQRFLFVPAQGYVTDRVIVDGIDVPDSLTGYTFANVLVDHSIDVSFRLFRLDDGLIAYYPMNGTPQDASGNGFHATGLGVSSAVDMFGAENGALDFDSTVSYLEVGGLPLRGPAFTYSVWAKVLESGTLACLETPDSAVGVWDMSYDALSHTIRLTDEVNGTLSVDADLGAGWNGIVAVYDETARYVYVNGVQLGKQAIATPFVAHPGDILRIGRSGVSGQQFRGSMDEVRLYGQALSDSAAKLLYIDLFKPEIKSITDVPGDQGGFVTVTWGKAFPDSAGTPHQVTQYGVWRRGVTHTAIPVNPAAKSTMGISNDTLSTAYECLGTVTAHQSPVYSYIAPTLEDSTASGPNNSLFLLTAHTGDTSIYFISRPGSGYSVDNLPPSAVSGLSADVQENNTVRLAWNPDTFDTDVGHYAIYRSTTAGGVTDQAHLIGTSVSATYVDESPVYGDHNYYCVVTVDRHDNPSPASAEAVLRLITTSSYHLLDGWNLVSVPLSVNDYSTDSLFRTAVSSAFSYAGSYVAQTRLANGTGYWLRFDGEQANSMTGFFRKADTIPVERGWNIIGSLSMPVPVCRIGSIPPNVTTGNFFGYQGSYPGSGYNWNYLIADTLLPGQGYWVNASMAGRLVLSATASSEVMSVSALHIVPSTEMPPPPPDTRPAGPDIPARFQLEQAYPNPFNPVARIQYALPVESSVRLTTHNVLGQSIAELVNTVESAGFKSIEWDASHLASGIYFYRLEAIGISDPSKTFASVRKVVLTK